ncbi:Nucleolar protein 9 [Alternaria ventricosa]|uniref:Nucleolar protein 9 n=1 Tax=Alternaria ventricosa TaxID=1187951 RepID=UPI0020C588F9|nr:Nucleolar protein 9 [Alternaria ventricosa]KAI4655813.1 Nucleolar protein 9 [Alternaria ventricosa]
MPKEHKKRGRREDQKKRKRDADDDASAKRFKKEDIDQLEAENPAQHVPEHDVARPDATPFYGMLDEQEQEYFKKADEMLELNQFESSEDRDIFLASVWKEADGKELKIANSQTSRLLERLILLSSPDQLKGLFQKFSGNFLNLVQNRFASHCCEALFIQAAPVVTQETAAKPEKLATPPSSDPDQVLVSMENLFLYTLGELEGYMGFLMTDKYASHVLRVLLVILSGAPLEKQNKSAMQSKKKEKVTVSGTEKDQERLLEERAVPESFSEALEKVISESVSGIESHYLRTLTTHPLGSPTLQLLLKLELSHFGKSRAKDEKSIIHRLLPDNPIAEGTESAILINGLVYDTIGSRLLEVIIENAPGKVFKSIYGEFFKERMGTLARNEIAAYVVGKIMERLGKDDLEEAMRQIVDQIPSLVERGRTGVIKTLIERCVARDIDCSPIKAQLETAYAGSNGFEVTRILKLSEEDGKPRAKHEHSPEKVHGSLLAQTMMTVDGPLGQLVFDSLANLSPELAVQLARDSTASRTLQAALMSKNASVIFRRKMIQQFYGKIGELALDPAASHVIDAIWHGTAGLAFIRERIAEELAENENSLRESFVGRAVWRNWRMDLYKRKRGDWVTQSRYTAGNDGFQSFPESNGDATPPQNHRAGRHLTAIELARQKHAAAKASQAKDGKKPKKGSHTTNSSVSSGSSSKAKSLVAQ